jgi:hypothetical protein
MNHRSFTQSLVAGACLLAFATTTSAQSIGGEVVEAMTAQPLRTYQVRLFYLMQGDSTHACDSTTTDERGLFQFGGQGAGRYRLEFGPPDSRLTSSARVEASTRDTAMRFIVEPTGKVRPGSAILVRSSHPGFTQAVLDALRVMRFSPARVGGIPVAQLVEEPFTFSLSSFRLPPM